MKQRINKMNNTTKYRKFSLKYAYMNKPFDINDIMHFAVDSTFCQINTKQNYHCWIPL